MDILKEASRIVSTEELTAKMKTYFPLAKISLQKFHANENNFSSQEIEIVVLRLARKYLMKGK